MTKIKRFAIIGCGYVAAKHLDAIRHWGGEVAWCIDPHDSVGVLDQYAPRCYFARTNGEVGPVGDVDCAVICSPNHLHLVHAEPWLEAGKHVVLEKPIGLGSAACKQVLGPHAGRVHPVVQLRDHPDVMAYPVAERAKAKEVEIRYHVWRGPWYSASWKGDEQRSGGILANIGVHLFDLALHLFGDIDDMGLESYGPDAAVGWLKHKQGTVTRWTLSTCSETTRRTISVDDGQWRLDLSDIAKHHLHRKVYERMILGSSWPVADVVRSIAVIEQLRSMR